MSHIDEDRQNQALRRFFIPGYLRFLLECLIALVLLVTINFNLIESTILRGYPERLTVTFYGSTLLHQFLTFLSQTDFAGNAIVFAFWTVVGMIVYVVTFRLFQAIYGVSSSLNQGMRYIKTKHARGAVYWFGTLHNFFMTILVVIVSIGLFISAASLVFILAPQQIHAGLSQVFPTNMLAFSFGFGLTLLSLRLTVMAACLSFQRFARWYLT